MPNAFAYFMIFAWPLVAAALFSALPRRQAIIWTILAGYLLLPTGTAIDLPLLPAFDKTLMPSIAALLLCLAGVRRRGDRGATGDEGSWLPASLAGKLLLFVFLLGPFVTVMFNSDPVPAGGGVWLKGLTLYDAFSFGLSHAVLIVPFLLARKYLANPDAHRQILMALMMAGLAYSALMVFEVRMSPQLHRWIYGFFPHSFLQQIRFGGFRPVVFLGHGLVVAIFAAMALLATLAIWREARGARRGRIAIAAMWLALVLVLCKSIGALALALLIVPALLFLTTRAQTRVAAVLGVIVLIYPLLRGADLVPVRSIIDAAASVSVERAGSLEVRIVNEDRLLARANERPLFGWGGWGRSRVYDPETGKDISITDGAWIITVGGYGWSGYVAEYGLLTGMLIMLARRRAPPPATTAALGLVLILNLLDLLPNSSQTPLTWLMAGALFGYAERAETAGARETRRLAATGAPPRRRAALARHAGPGVSLSAGRSPSGGRPSA
jgi:hypothetical protein